MTLSGSYLDRDEFAALTTAPAELVAGDFIDPSNTWDGPHSAKRDAWRAFIDAQLIHWSALINDRLAKRYDAPFKAPYPATIRGWLAILVTPMVYRKRGVDPSDEQISAADTAAEKVEAKLSEAANSETGLFELPLRADNAASAVSRGGPFSYSEASPYDWLDVQRDAVRS